MSKGQQGLLPQIARKIENNASEYVRLAEEVGVRNRQKAAELATQNQNHHCLDEGKHNVRELLGILLHTRPWKSQTCRGLFRQIADYVSWQSGFEGRYQHDQAKVFGLCLA